MAYKVVLNPFDGSLQLVNSSSSSGGVTGIAPTTVGAIATWDDTTATTIQNTQTNVQASGAIEAQGYITNRTVTATVTVNTGKTWISPSLILAPGSLVILNPDAELIII
jgi:hypothetical protein